MSDELTPIDQELWNALDKAAYALFQIKRMTADGVPAFAGEAHHVACETLNKYQRVPANTDSKGETGRG